MYVVWILWLYLLNTACMLLVAIREVRRPAKALNWLAICLVLPVIGFALYLITSNPLRIRRERLTSMNTRAEPLPDSFSRSASVIAQALHPFTVHGLRTGRVQVLQNGTETYGRLIQSLQNAQRTINLEYYTYRDDQIGRRITDVLIERAASGVQVRFVRDGWGSRKFPRDQIMRMTDAGIECRTMFPLRFPTVLSTLNYRDHCKIVVIDGTETFTGGINVGDEYLGLKKNIGFWRDTHVRMVGEEVAADLEAIFNVHWKIATPERIKQTRKPNAAFGRATLAGLSAEWGAELGNREGADLDTVPSTEALQHVYVQTVEGNPGIPTEVIREAYFICLTQATQTVDITTPYFVPDADIIMAMKTAVARGVRVRLLVPRQVVPRVVGPASHTYYGELVEAGVDVYLYEKGMLHAKVMIIDGEIAEVGAANYDTRSFRLDFEVCEFFYSVALAQELTEQFERDLTESVPLRMEDLLKRTRSQRILEQGARLLSPLL
jgi:cardiolipin synthase A/B